MALFDAYVMVDWSGAATPCRGKDSIWYAVLLRDGAETRQTALENPSTRQQATEELCDRLAALVADGRRVLAGFDFPFGYPCGTAERLGINGGFAICGCHRPSRSGSSPAQGRSAARR